jgi:hypothetical protein
MRTEHREKTKRSLEERSNRNRNAGSARGGERRKAGKGKREHRRIGSRAAAEKEIGRGSREKWVQKVARKGTNVRKNRESEEDVGRRGSRQHRTIEDEMRNMRWKLGDREALGKEGRDVREAAFGNGGIRGSEM